MSKTSSVYTRVEPEIKEQAEQIFARLGIPMANAINLFLHQVVLQKGIPFNMKLPQNIPLDFKTLTEEQFNDEIEKGYDDLTAGKTLPAKQVFENMNRLYGI